MPEPLQVAKNPCATCPYRKDVPAGVWAAEEYEKLPGFDHPTSPSLGVFLCHQSTIAGTDFACKGWVMVHRESIAVRLAQLHGKLCGATCFAPTDVELHESGEAAAAFGLAGVDRPKRAALKVIAKLNKTGRYKTNDQDAKGMLPEKGGGSLV